MSNNAKPDAMAAMGEMLVASEKDVEAMRTELQLERVARATAEGALQVERETRQRAETDRDGERAARVTAESARAAAEALQTLPAPVVTQIETARKPGTWRFEVQRDGAQQIRAIVAVPEERK